MFQVSYIIASALVKTKTFKSMGTWFHTIPSHIHHKARGLFCSWRKNITIAAPVNICIFSNLCISAMGSSDNAAWSGLWVINQVGGSSINLFILLVAQAK